jgi:hypothetical protein
MAAQDYKSWLRSKGLTSSKQNAAKWRNVMRRQPPFSYAGQVARDPLSIPYGGEIVWQGAGRPNLDTLGGRGFENLTPIRRPGGGWAVFGVDSDPMPDFARDQMADITKRGAAVQAYAQGTVAPWLANQVGALNNVQTQAQTNFANLIGQGTADLAAAAQQAGPGAAYADTAAMAPFQSREGVANQLAADAAKSAAAGAGYQAAVDQLQGSNLAQGLQSSLAQSIARIPDEYEQQRQDFMRQLTPVLMQIQENRKQGEFQRLQALEQRRTTNKQLAIERQIAGMNAEVDLANIAADQAADAAAAQDQAVHDQFRTLSQIRSGLDQGETLLDNGGRGFGGRPGFAKYHGRPVTWEQATDGSWYGVVGKRGGGSGGSGGDTVWSSDATNKSLTDSLLKLWQGDPDDGREGWRTYGRDDLRDAEARLRTNLMYPREFQIARWIDAHRGRFARNGKLRPVDVQRFLGGVLPELNDQAVVSYLQQYFGG